MKNAILRYETQGALLHHNFSSQKLNQNVTWALFQPELNLEQTVSILNREGFALPAGASLRKIRNTPVPDAYSAPLKLFMDVTNFCNLACSHCLSSSDSHKSDTLTFETIEDIADQCEEVGVFYVKVGGGEPLLYPRILELIDMLNAHSLDVSLTTNGTMIKPELAGKLRDRSVKTSVSIDGIQPTHDAIRGKGTYEKAVSALRILKEEGSDVSIRTTLFPSNIADIPDLVELAEQYDVILKIRRAKPSGRAIDNMMVMTHPTPEYFALIKYLNQHSSRVDIEDIMNTQPGYKKDVIVSTADCGAGTRSIHVDQHGNVSPCVFLGKDFIAGNIFKDSKLIDVWRRTQEFARIRKLASHENCYSCPRERVCHNECPAIKLYATGRLSGLDPACLQPYLQPHSSKAPTTVNVVSQD